MADQFLSLAQRAHADGWQPTARLLALDPGDTTGWSFFEEGMLSDAGQVPGERQNIGRLLLLHQPGVVVCEEYRIYGNKAMEHVGSTVPTLRLIGALELLCEQQEIPLTFQSARDAKGFVTDPKLRQWGYYRQSLGHGTDSIRHGCYYLLFGAAVSQEVERKTAQNANPNGIF